MKSTNMYSYERSANLERKKGDDESNFLPRKIYLKNRICEKNKRK